MRNKFDQQLETLHIELIKMGALCEDGITASITALEKGDISLLKKVSETEVEIDQMERDIESMCMKLLLQQQPVATDLRVISSALKMITDMERIGDQAADIAEIARFIISNGNRVNDDIKKMAEDTIKMVTESVDSFVTRDLELARKVMAYDDVVDNWFNTLKKEIIEMIARDSTNGEYYIDILMIIKYLERIGDHATNIAEWVEFSITGVRSMNN